MDKSEVSFIRESVPGDKHFILSTWLRGLYYGETLYSLMEKATFMELYKKVLDYLVTNSYIQVMCLKEDPNIIIGYSVLSLDKKILHWLYVKKNFRNIGVATDLVPKDVKVVTHLTKSGIILLKRKNMIYNPFLVS